MYIIIYDYIKYYIIIYRQGKYAYNMTHAHTWTETC